VRTHVYEINVKGELSPALLAELGATRTLPPQAETVITTHRLGPEQLYRIVARISDLGMDVLVLRRLPGTPAALSA
jgi:hypothetical protein